MKTKNVITGLFVIMILASCAPVVVAPTTTNIPASTITSIPPTPTAMPTATAKPTATVTPAPKILKPVRPVNLAVPLYHGFEQIIDMNIPRYGNKHTGYDYGFQNCIPISYNVIAIEDGEVMQLGGEWDVWLDHGEVQLTNGEVWRVMSAYYHIKYVDALQIGEKIEKGQTIAHFVDCNTMHPEGKKYYPELHLSMYLADTKETTMLNGQALLSYMVDNQFNVLGNFTVFDPVLIGLPPK